MGEGGPPGGGGDGGDGVTRKAARPAKGDDLSRLDLRGLKSEHRHAIAVLQDHMGCRTATEAVRLALVIAARMIEGYDPFVSRRGGQR